MIINETFMRISNLAHINDMTLETFVKHLETIFAVDNSHLPKDAEGNILYPNGNVGLDLNLDSASLLTLHTIAAEKNVKVNDLIIEAIVDAAKKKGVLPKA